jgi:hypothetical protein
MSKPVGSRPTPGTVLTTDGSAESKNSAPAAGVARTLEIPTGDRWETSDSPFVITDLPAPTPQWISENRADGAAFADQLRGLHFSHSIAGLTTAFLKLNILDDSNDVATQELLTAASSLLNQIQLDIERNSADQAEELRQVVEELELMAESYEALSAMPTNPRAVTPQSKQRAQTLAKITRAAAEEIRSKSNSLALTATLASATLMPDPALIQENLRDEQLEQIRQLESLLNQENWPELMVAILSEQRQRVIELIDRLDKELEGTPHQKLR